MRHLIFICLACVSLVFLDGCDPFKAWNETKQFKTFFRMETVQGRLNRAAATKHALLTESEALAIIRSDNNGVDEWGNELIYDHSGAHTLLISKGSDGRLDVPDVRRYYSLAEADIREEPAHDIVWRDGLPITLVGK
jgi:hypothetical protein